MSTQACAVSIPPLPSLVHPLTSCLPMRPLCASLVCRDSCFRARRRHRGSSRSTTLRCEQLWATPCSTLKPSGPSKSHPGRCRRLPLPLQVLVQQAVAPAAPPAQRMSQRRMAARITGRRPLITAAWQAFRTRGRWAWAPATRLSRASPRQSVATLQPRCCAAGTALLLL